MGKQIGPAKSSSLSSRQPDKLVVVWTRRNRRVCSKVRKTGNWGSRLGGRAKGEVDASASGSGHMVSTGRKEDGGEDKGLMVVRTQEDSLLPPAGPQLAARHPEPIPWHCGVDGPGERGHLCDLVQGESLELRHRQA